MMFFKHKLAINITKTNIFQLQVDIVLNRKRESEVRLTVYIIHTSAFNKKVESIFFWNETVLQQC